MGLLASFLLDQTSAPRGEDNFLCQMDFQVSPPSTNPPRFSSRRREGHIRGQKCYEDTATSRNFLLKLTHVAQGQRRSVCRVPGGGSQALETCWGGCSFRFLTCAPSPAKQISGGFLGGPCWAKPGDHRGTNALSRKDHRAPSGDSPRGLHTHATDIWDMSAPRTSVKRREAGSHE